MASNVPPNVLISLREMSLRLCLSLFFALALSAGTAEAHKLQVFASVDGINIQGKAYFRGGGAAQGAAVTAVDSSGRQLGRTTTDGEGKFVLPARQRCDYRIVVDAADGHGGEWIVRAAELPGGLPAGDAATDIAAASRDAPSAAAAEADQPSADIKALKAQVEQLRQQIADYESHIRLHDMLGGIGYILGLAGLYALLARRRRKRD
jgi:nickel transport protein